MKLVKSDLQIETIVSRIKADELDLQPDFQRGEIWDLKRRQRLVDTILRDWYVPAIHIVIGPEGDEVVLDGQQRLAAIRDFIADKIPVDGTIEPHDARVHELNGLKYSQLPVSVRKAVNRFIVQVITLDDYKPQEPNELFFRLNQSYNLTPPEKRNALHGKARNQVKELVIELTETGLLAREKIGFTNGRLAYDDIIARVCVAIEIANLRKHINNNVVEDYYRSEAFADETVDSVRRAGFLLMEQIDNCDTRIKFNKGTLQTWLIYCHWAPSGMSPLPPKLLESFERERSRIRKGEAENEDYRGIPVAEVVRIYDDRASYRVTDVTSVLARDLAVHLFSQQIFDTPSYRGSHVVLENLAASTPAMSQTIFFDFIESSQWGNPIGPQQAAL